ncbi:hypothetical protein OCU04_012956 [Sclerotinia nivalis]|uniref:Uncharacterized protein n=1 Tax=Sclerotinia nivalis TaxID=352851 RepID=A0A9X0DE08_9HELO|nr:hypothetical protein OCU04_012956 [Sclerotinia nivalis]
MSHQAPELVIRSARLPPQLTQSICLRCAKRIANYDNRKVLPDGKVINKECFFPKGIDLSYAEYTQKKKTCDAPPEVFHSAINRMLRLHCEWEAALAGSSEEATVRRSLNGYQFNFIRKVEAFLRKQKKYNLKREPRDTKEAILMLNVQMEKGMKLFETGVNLFRYFIDKLASEIKLEDTSSEEDSSDAAFARSKSSKSFRTPAKRASCKSAKSKTKGIRNIGDRIVKKEWITSPSIFKTKKIGEVRKLVFAKRKISEPIEPFNDDDEDIESIDNGKPSVSKKSKKKKTKTFIVINIPFSPSKSFGILSTIPEPSVILSAKRQEAFVLLTKSSIPIMDKEATKDKDLLNFSSSDISLTNLSNQDFEL